jgi:hypothetical protein
MSAALAGRFERRLIAGKTFKDLTNPQSKSFIVPDSRFKKHCKLNPIWADRVKELNKASITKKWKLTSGHGNATKKFCLRGLHRMTKANVLIDGVGHRRCRACRYISMPGHPMTAESLDQIKEAIRQGASFAQICHGKPIGGGPRDSSLSLTTAAKFQRQRRIDPDFDAFVNEYFASSNSVGQILRHHRDLPAEMKPTLIAVGRLKHKIKAIRAT